ncbi:MAG TPA: hypothetical protein VHN11_19730 [Xanthobacteraceae bacterium]|jgi:hypothetical protein|nr:hypothetical protein [Xanthobacteraceae bacterium]
MKRKLYELAHSRAGDKGNTTTLSVIAYRREDYELLRNKVTAAAVKEHFAGIIKGEVSRFELPHLSALQFVGREALGGGVTVTLALDAHGKCMSSALLEMEIEVDD